MKNFLRSLALVALATMSITAINAGSEWREGQKREGKSKMRGEKSKSNCTPACKAHFQELERIINENVENPSERAKLKKAIHMKHCYHHKLEWLGEHMCQTCKNKFEKHKQETCMKCEECKYVHGHKKMHKKNMPEKHEHKRKRQD